MAKGLQKITFLLVTEITDLTDVINGVKVPTLDPRLLECLIHDKDRQGFGARSPVDWRRREKDCHRFCRFGVSQGCISSFGSLSVSFLAFHS